jgi:hypothetical protein
MTVVHERILECLKGGGSIESVEEFNNECNISYPAVDVLIAMGELLNGGLVAGGETEMRITEKGSEYLAGNVDLRAG